MNFEEAVEYLKSFVSYEDLVNMKNEGKGFDLDRVRNFVKDYGVELGGLRIVHVGGSKGKGSVSKIVAQYLYDSGKSVGMFTSPYMQNITECFWVNGEEISREGFVGMVEELKGVVEEKCELTYFELLTVLVLKYFVDRGADFAVLEVGLGGRLDATNIVDSEVAVVNTIEKEHTEILGESFEEIVGEKMGIVKGGTKVVVGWQNDEVLGLLKERLIEGGKDAVFVQEKEGLGLEADSVVQARNGDTAYYALEALLGKVEMSVFERAFVNSGLPGRFDVRVIDGKSVVLDMAHTERSMENLIQSLKKKFPEKKFVFLVSLMKGKNISSILRQIEAVADKIVYTVSHDVRSEDPHEMCKIVNGEINDDPVNAFVSLKNELKKDQVLIVTGSHFLVSKVISTL